MKLYLKYLAVVFLAVCLLTGCAGGGRIRLDKSLQDDVVSFGGYQYVPLSRACDVYGLKCDWDTFTRKMTVRYGGHYVIAMAGSDHIIADGIYRQLPRPVLFYSGTVYVPVSLVGQDLVMMVASSPREEMQAAAPVAVIEEQKGHTIKTIVLDAGHGGGDIGAKGRYHMLLEKDKALAITKKVRGILEKKGLKVIMTRDEDVFIPLPKRAELANKAGADLFVSIHINSSRSRLLRGFECYYLSDAADDNARALEAAENSSLKLNGQAGVEHSTGLDKTLWDMTLTENRIESAQLAGDIVDSVTLTVPIQNRGVKTAKFYVLKHTNMPSVLVEVCYISNRVDETKLKNVQFQDNMANAIAGGILKYRTDFERTEGFTKI